MTSLRISKLEGLADEVMDEAKNDRKAGDETARQYNECRIAALEQSDKRCCICRSSLRSEFPHWHNRKFYCDRCAMIPRRAAHYSHLSHEDLVISAIGNHGIGRRFCFNNRVPALSDPGIAERVSARPLPSGGLLVVGPVGTHKSHLLAARTMDAAMRGWAAYFLNWHDFVLRVRGSYGPKATETESEIVSTFTKLDYLAIDDLGVGTANDDGKESEASRLLCYIVLNRRYDANRVTDVSSNMTPDEITARFDDRIGRRLREMCTTYPMLEIAKKP